MADSLDLAGISSDLKEYARDNKDHIFLDVYTPSENEADRRNGIVPMSEYSDEMDTPDEVVFTHIYVNGALKPGGVPDEDGKIFRPKENAVGMKTRKGKVREIQMDFLFTREKIIRLKKSYFAQCKRMDINPDVLPFEQYILAELLKEANAELRIAYYKGVYDDEGQSYLDCFDGWLKQIADAITAAEIPVGNIKSQAAITANNAVAQFEGIVDIIPTEMLNKVVCLSSRANKGNYQKDYRSKYGTVPWNTGVEKSYIDGTSIPILVEPGLDAYTKPIFVPKDNLIRLYDSTSDKLGLDVDYDPRERNIAFTFDGQAGCGLGLGKHLWTMVAV